MKTKIHKQNYAELDLPYRPPYEWQSILRFYQSHSITGLERVGENYFERLFRINRNGRIAWKTEALGLDGVVVDAIDDKVILGQAEWDPPGGWRPFQVKLESGEILVESGERV